MARKVKTVCNLCGEEVLPRSCGGTGRMAHLKEKHPDAEGGIYKNFAPKEYDNYSGMLVKKSPAKVKAKDLKASEKSKVVPTVATKAPKA